MSPRKKAIGKKYAKCPICNSFFEKKHHLQKYCSKECAHVKKREQQKTYTVGYYYFKHPDKKIALEKARQEHRKMKQKEYYLSHKEKIKEYGKTHKEKISLKRRERYNSDPEFRERVISHQKVWQRKNLKKKGNIRKERLLKAIDEYITKQREGS